MPPNEAMNLRFVIGAFVVTWVMLTAYSLYVHATVRRARAAYESALARASAKGAK